MREIVGTTKIITFRATKSPAWFGDQMIRIALLLTFNDEMLFRKYVQFNEKIPNKIKQNPHTNETYYEVYFSLWPENEWDFESKSNSLQDQKYDYIESPKYLDDEYTPALSQFRPANPYYMVELANLIRKLRLNPAEQNLLKSRQDYALLREANSLTGIKLNLQKLQDKYDDIVIQAAILYAESYDHWLSAKNCAPQIQEAAGYQEILTTAHNIMQKSEQDLKHMMFPEQLNLSDEEFRIKLQSYILYICPETFEIIVPFIKEGSATDNTNGLSLEATLKLIDNITTNPKDYPHMIFGKNPARLPLLVLQSALQVKNSSDLDMQYQKATAPPAVNVLRFSSPAMAQSVEDTVHNKLPWSNSLLNKARNFIRH